MRIHAMFAAILDSAFGKITSRTIVRFTMQWDCLKIGHIGHTPLLRKHIRKDTPRICDTIGALPFSTPWNGSDWASMLTRNFDVRTSAITTSTDRY